MANIAVNHNLTISPSEAANGARKLLNRRGKRLEVIIPAGVKTGTLVKLNGALQITDGYYGDILIQIKVKRRQRAVLATAIISGLFIVTICSVVIGYFAENSGGGTEPEFTTTFIYVNGDICVGGDNQPIELVNYSNAINPTYAQLIAFIKGDTTDSNEYIEEGSGAYICSDFAEDIHNNAEAVGIRAAWVGIDIEGDDEGHALNTFKTTDRGLVYIDCINDDAVAFVEIGKELGFIPVTYAKSLSYSFYEEYMEKGQEFETKLEAHNLEIERYNQEISGKVYTIGSEEEARITTWEYRLVEEEQELERLSRELGESCYEQLGIVKDIHIHW